MNKFGLLAVVAGVILGLGLIIGYLGSRGPDSEIKVGVPPNPKADVEVAPAVSQAQPRTNPAAVASKDSPSRPLSQRPRPTGVSDPAPANTSTNWEDRLDHILSAEGEDTDKVHQMMAMFPQLPPEGQEEVAQHMANLVPDEQYGPLAGYLTNSALSEDVLDVLVADLLNRPNSVKLPFLLDIARNEQHAKRDEARDLLELFLEEDYGSDWPKWQARMQEWLRDNPD